MNKDCQIETLATALYIAMTNKQLCMTYSQIALRFLAVYKDSATMDDISCTGLIKDKLQTFDDYCEFVGHCIVA